MSSRWTHQVRIPVDLRWEVWERDDFRCRICGVRRNLSVDHILAVCDGGETTSDNLQTLCRSCNSRKEGKMPRRRQLPPADLEFIPSAMDRTVREEKREREFRAWQQSWIERNLPHGANHE